MHETANEKCDLVVVGSGAAGFSAAITGAKAGLDVVLIEKAPVFGGTTAYSGGFMWVPNSSLARQAGIEDSIEAATTYIRHLAGPYYDSGLIESYLAHAPAMLDFMLDAGLKVNLERYVSDFHSETPGAKRGRAISPAPVHGSILGKHLPQLREPLPETTFLGIRIGSGEDMQNFMNVARSWKAAAYVMKRMANHGLELLRHGRAMRFVNGHALIAQLASIACAAGAQVRLSTSALRLVEGVDGIAGVEIEHQGARTTLLAKKAVILTGGGFPHDVERRQAFYPHPADTAHHFSLAPATNTGDSARMAEDVGGGIVTCANPGAWMPVTRIPKRDGTARTFMHSFAAAKGGFITVTPEGRRYVNESQAWQDVCEPMLTARDEGLPAEAFLIGDHRAVRKHGLGFAKPFPVPLQPYLASGYLIKGRTIEELADKAGIDPAQLSATIAAFNNYAKEGVDPDFHRGAGRFSRVIGDPDIKPNPTLAPIVAAPFYAVKVYPGDIGTLAGIRTDGQARVTREGGDAIARLYAAGNDMASIFGGAYPGGGCTIGPAMTFGYVAARHAATLPDRQD